VVLGGAKRLGFISDYLDSLIESPLLLLYGEGWVGETENNVFDLLEAFGVWGLAFYLIWAIWAANLYLSLRDKRHHSEKSIVLVGILLLIFISAFAGHILQSAMLAPFIAMLACMPYVLEMRAEYPGPDKSIAKISTQEPQPAGAA
jgi:O-antigen ligase